MQFQLPANLRTELLAYDPKLKALAKTTAATANKPKKQRTHLGLPDDIIPAHIVTPNDLLAAVTAINQAEVPYRYHTFSSVTYDKDITATKKLKAVIYHYESLWIAAWLPNAGEDYIYGFTYAFKNTEATRKQVYIRDIDIKDTTIKKYGRIEFNVYTHIVTVEDVSNGCQSNYWEHGNFKGYNAKGKEIRRSVIQPFREAIINSIPTYTDGLIWDRIDTAKNNYHELLDLRFASIPKNQNIVPSFELYMEILGVRYTQDSDRSFTVMQEKLSKPWFKRYINEQCQLIINTFNDPATKSKKEISSIHKKLIHTLAWILDILDIYPDCPMDYLQTGIQTNMFLSLGRIYSINYYRTDSLAKVWLATNLPVASLFNMLNKYIEDEKPGNKYKDNQLDCYMLTFYSFRDTMDMIYTVLAAGKELTPPRRWRYTEFHDHVQAEAWKISNPNQKLPQDLFPVPVKVKLDDESWTFIQPIDTHQLAQWGQAVRNCVGASSTYANNVKAKKNFLVLCLVDNKPQFTVQLKVSNGVMDVVQIAGVSNSSLLSEERGQYQSKFAEALKIRESELCSA
jgi:hypothetical protein